MVTIFVTSSLVVTDGLLLWHACVQSEFELEVELYALNGGVISLLRVCDPTPDADLSPPPITSNATGCLNPISPNMTGASFG
jgi:hypothetical protein